MKAPIIEKQGAYTYLVYEFGEDEELDTMNLGMLTNNSIPGFAPVTITRMDNTRYVKYNISSRVSASQVFCNVVNKQKVLSIFSGIVNALLSAEDYMLDASSVLLDQNFIFADAGNYETVMICLPLLHCKQENPDLVSFFKNIICNIKTEQNNDAGYITRILNYLNSVSVVSLHDFRHLLDQLTDHASRGLSPHLIRRKNGDKVTIEKPLFHIGKDPKYADYCISDNMAISRKHADIIARNGEYFVMDTRSTNSTFVNGKVIAPNEEIKIDHGTVLCLADEYFEFRLN